MIGNNTYLVLSDVTERNLFEATKFVRGYLKFTSMLWIRALRQPILDGLIVKHWSTPASAAVDTFRRRHQCEEVLLRIDTLGERWSRRRGGYLVAPSKLRGLVRELNREGRIAAFLEPASPYQDRYCLGAITDELQRTMTVEVVGRGFDTSDLLRSDLSPHERFEMDLSHSLEKVSFTRTHIVSPSDYETSVSARLIKIGARLINPSYPDLQLASRKISEGLLQREAIAYLKRTRQVTLLNHSKRYQPIPKRLLWRFALGVGSIVQGLRRYNIDLGATSFSATFTNRGRFVFWDFFPAKPERSQLLY